MAKMGTYCKAYPAERFREFKDWTENTTNLRVTSKSADDKEGEAQNALSDEHPLYLQENFVVTDGIFIDENIIFDSTSPDWIDFCKNSLKFEIPVYQTVQVKSAE